ncbi:EAL domain-containing protein [Pantoea sp. Z09]|uniref:EAL domain-containing protein n=1 Tax=Pantoea sp. Z09 TaxID=2886821 RepID=UPI001EFE55B9|nr:EAL domain-containing protein [Pantoea sp. Z09]
MGRQLHLHQHYEFLLEPIHSPSGDAMAWELLTRAAQEKGSVESGHQLFENLLGPEKWQLFQLQLEKISALYQSGFAHIVSLNVDGEIISHILASDAVQQKLDRLPLLRLEVSTFFTTRYQARDRLLLQKLVGITPALLWLDDFGAGSSTLSMLSSGIFEYVKTDKNFFWKYGEGFAFDSLLNHVNDLCRGVIVQGVNTPQHLDMLAHKPVVGLQGGQWKSLSFNELTGKTTSSSRLKTLKTVPATAINYRNFL